MKINKETRREARGKREEGEEGRREREGKERRGGEESGRGESVSDTGTAVSRQDDDIVKMKGKRRGREGRGERETYSEVCRSEDSLVRRGFTSERVVKCICHCLLMFQ